MTLPAPRLLPAHPLRCALCAESETCHLDAETSKQRESLATYLAELKALVARGGPEPEDYERINAGLEELFGLMGSCGMPQRHVCRIREALGSTMTAETMQGFAYTKPYGYAGDFDIIDRIYRRHVSSDPRLEKWDRFAHEQHALVAVRNRKTYFKQLLRSLIRERGEGGPVLRVLNVASGPGRDLYEFFQENPDARVRFDCVEADPRAIDYASRLCADHLAHIRFHAVNAFRFTSEDRYDLIWSAGLFDYFTDRLFVRLLNRLARLARPDAELVIGNFGEQNRSRSYMELVGEWHLHHRSEAKLLKLAAAMAVPPAAARVECEDSGLNLFLRIRPGALPGTKSIDEDLR